MSKKQDGEYESTIQHMLTLIRASQPLIWCKTHEEDRLLLDLHFYIKKNIKKEWAIYVWSATSGMREYNTETVGLVPPEKGTLNLSKALDFVSEYDTFQKKVAGAIFVMLDINPLFNPPLPRKLRDMYKEIAESGQIKSMVFLSPTASYEGGRKTGIEPTLEKQMPLLTFGLPSSDVIRGYVERSISKLSGEIGSNVKKHYKIDYSVKEVDEIVNALQGLTLEEIQRAMMTSLQHLKGFYPEHMLKTKRQIIDRGQILEYIESRPDWADVGGLENAKDYFRTYSNQFSQAAKEYGVEPLKGVLLTGIPGTGKSLIAKAVASEWKIPLLRLDIGKVMTGLVGGSEEKMRQVVEQVESISPCLLWIDEIEKSLSGTKSSNNSDGGTLSRVFGTLLTAMEERMENVVTIATANNIQSLPPELIRRFNEVFFVDLPSVKEREDILEIHLSKRGRDLKKLNINQNAFMKATDGFTGAEIEKTVKEAIARAFVEGKPDVDDDCLLLAARGTKPISQVMKEQIDEIRTWAKGRARLASSIPETKKQTKKPKEALIVERGLEEMEDFDKKLEKALG